MKSKKFDQIFQTKNSFSDTEVEELNKYAEAGDSHAQWLKGLYSYAIEHKEKEALEEWTKAALQGNQQAMANLGDHYFALNAPNYWEKAYFYYTQEGAMVQSEPRRRHIKDIFNHGKYNLRVFILSLISLLVCLGMVILMQVAGEGGLVAGILCLALQSGLLAVMYVRYRKSPFLSLNVLLPGMLFIWMLRMYLYSRGFTYYSSPPFSLKKAWWIFLIVFVVVFVILSKVDEAGRRKLNIALIVLLVFLSAVLVSVSNRLLPIILIWVPSMVIRYFLKWPHPSAQPNQRGMSEMISLLMGALLLALM